MVFALERTAHALQLLSLEKIGDGYCIHHYDKRLLNKSSQLAQLHDLCTTLQQMSANVIVGVNDADLIIRHIHINPPHKAKIYSYCQAMLAQELSLHDYSWDVYPLKSYQGSGHYLLCIAYPLEKILFLQELLKFSGARCQVLEPSICALARLSLMLLKLSSALFLLYENNLFTLILVLKGEVFAVRQFAHMENLEENIATLPFKPEKIIYLQDEKLSIDIFQYVQTQRYRINMESWRLWAPIGLALRCFV